MQQLQTHCVALYTRGSEALKLADSLNRRLIALLLSQWTHCIALVTRGSEALKLADSLLIADSLRCTCHKGAEERKSQTHCIALVTRALSFQIAESLHFSRITQIADSLHCFCHECAEAQKSALKRVTAPAAKCRRTPEGPPDFRQVYNPTGCSQNRRLIALLLSQGH
eukprot:980066-Amphidinium_carterae.1